MKLILTQEVTGLGAPGDVVEVKDGYGRNYLVPRGLALRWTRGGEKQIESIKAARASRAVRDLGHAEEVKTKLEAQPVSVKVRAGAGGRLFGAVTVGEIAEALAAHAAAEAVRTTLARGAPGRPATQELSSRVAALLAAARQAEGVMDAAAANALSEGACATNTVSSSRSTGSLSSSAS